MLHTGEGEGDSEERKKNVDDEREKKEKFVRGMRRRGKNDKKSLENAIVKISEKCSFSNSVVSIIFYLWLLDYAREAEEKRRAEEEERAEEKRRAEGMSLEG